MLGCSREEEVRVADLLNCKLGSFPFVYLGVPISPFNLCSKDFAPSVLKVGNRVTPWRGRYNSTAGKVYLTNACLSSLPMFLMGFYRLPEGTHAGYNKHRSAFYWNSSDNKKKYTKSHGGLGITNTSIMNKCRKATDKTVPIRIEKASRKDRPQWEIHRRRINKSSNI